MDKNKCSQSLAISALKKCLKWFTHFCSVQKADKFPIASIKKGLIVPTVSDFISVLNDLPALNKMKRGEMSTFEHKFATYWYYAQSSHYVPLGRFTSNNLEKAGQQTYYIRLSILGSGSTNDSRSDRLASFRHVRVFRQGVMKPDHEKALIFGRLIVDNVETYWVVAIDKKHKLYVLRANGSGPDDEYWLDNPKPDASEGYAASRNQSSSGSISQSGNNNNNNNSIRNPFRLTATEVDVIDSRPPNKTANVFDATPDQVVIKLGHLSLLDDALKNHDQELSPVPCPYIKAWESTPLFDP